MAVLRGDFETLVMLSRDLGLEIHELRIVSLTSKVENLQARSTLLTTCFDWQDLVVAKHW